MSLVFQAVDTMKASRDSNSWTNAQKVEHINAMVHLMPGLTHIPLACYFDNYGWQSIAYVKEWFDAVHNAGKYVFFRPAYAAMGGWTNATTHIPESIENLVDCWESGDALDIWPEFSPSSNPTVTQWNQLIRDLVDVCTDKFTELEKDVDATYWSMTDQQFIWNTRVEAETLTALGNKLCIDFYPMDIGSLRGKLWSCFGQLSRAHTNYPTADLYITEIGYNNMFGATDEDQRTVIGEFLNELSNIPYVKGLNYWHGYGNSAFDKCLVFKSLSRTQPRPALAMLGEYFTHGACSQRVKII